MRSCRLNNLINWSKRICITIGFLISFGLGYAFAQSNPTNTPTPAALSWPQFRYIPQNTGFYQPFDDSFFTKKWQVSLGNPRVSYSSAPVVLDLGTNNSGMLVIGTTNGQIQAYGLDGSPLWNYQTQGEVYSSPAILSQGVNNSRIFVGSSDGVLRALGASGNLVWQYQTNDAIMSSPIEGLIQKKSLIAIMSKLISPIIAAIL